MAVFDLSAVWNLAAGMAIALTLWAVAIAALAFAKSWRLSTDGRVIAAAERLEAVRLTWIIKRYVPREHQTNKATEELAIAKQVIRARLPRWRRAALLSCVFVPCGAGAAAFLLQQELAPRAMPKLAAQSLPGFDVLRDVRGVWGWRADFAQSCNENPQTISVNSGGRKLSIRYAKPYHSGAGMIDELEYDIESTGPAMLVASKEGSPKPLRVYIKFIDRDSFVLSWSDDPMTSSGTIARCH